MNKRLGSIIVAFGACFICSCSNDAEVAKLREEVKSARTEAAEAKATAEELKAESIKSKADAAAAIAAVEKAKSDAEAARIKLAMDLAEAMKRWNVLANRPAVEIPNFGNVTFLWQGNGFPHPTFKGGSAEAYGAFALVLRAFFENGDNFEFLATNKLFNANLMSGPPGSNAGITFAKLAEQFSQPNAHGNHDAETRKALKEISDRIQTGGKKKAIQ